MFTQGFGEVLTDMLTVSPEFSELPAASSILDTSNYTFQAITYGKDAQGYNYHGHVISSVEYVNDSSDNDVSGYNGGKVVVRNYANDEFIDNGYTVSVVNSYLEDMEILPNYPHNYDTRLERQSTETILSPSYSATTHNLGHYANAAIDSELSSVWNVVGGFPPAGNNSKYYIFSGDTDATLGFAYSGTLSGVYNEFGLVDKYGYVTVNPNGPLDSGLSSTTNEQGSDLSAGVCIFSAAGLAPSNAVINIAVVPQRGDAASLLLFGSCYHIGVYCLDLKEMLSSGITPPYSWDALNNNRKYKLVGKMSFWEEIIRARSAGVGTTTTLGGVRLLATDPLGALINKGPLFTLKFNFL